MRKSLFLIIIVLFSSAMTMAGDELYDEVFVKRFDMGYEDTALKYIEFPNPIDQSGPNSMGFDPLGNFYLCDTWNNRILVFDADFEEKNTINLKSSLEFANMKQLEIKDDNIIGFKSGLIFGGLSTGGEVRYLLDLGISRWHKELDTYNFYLLGTSIVYYKRNGTPVLFTDLEPEIQENQEKGITGDLFLEGFEDYTIEQNRIVKDNKVYTRDFKVFISYWQTQHEGTDSPPYAKRLPGVDFMKLSNVEYLGIDEDGNSYWRSYPKRIFVFDDQGWLLDNFFFNHKKTKVIPAIHPSGDIYLLDYNQYRARLYKIPRVW